MNKKKFNSAINWAFRKFNVQFPESSLSSVVPEWQWKLAISDAIKTLKKNFKEDFKSRSFFYTEITTYCNLVEKNETFSFSFSFENDSWEKKVQRGATRLVFRFKKKGSKTSFFRCFVQINPSFDIDEGVLYESYKVWVTEVTEEEVLLRTTEDRNDRKYNDFWVNKKRVTKYDTV